MKTKNLLIKELRKDLYLFNDCGESSGFLIIGNDKSCFIDTMNGNFDFAAEIRLLTDKPIMVINTHGHPDHIYGNIYFDKAYIHPDDIELATMFFTEPEFVEKCKKNNLFVPPFEEIKEGDVIDLGGKTLKIYDIKGHTQGGILLLCPEERILFTGDSVNHHLWMQVPTATSISVLIKSLEKNLFLENEADLILHGHALDFDDISLLRSVLEGAKEILDEKTREDLEYKWFGGVCKQHKFTVDSAKKFQQDNHVIVYNEGNII